MGSLLGEIVHYFRVKPGRMSVRPTPLILLLLPLLLLLFLPCNATGQEPKESSTATENHTQTLYVVVNATQCPKNTSHPCKLLRTYMQNTDKYFTSNTTMIFYGGTHIAYGGAVEMKNVSSFAMIGVGEFTQSQYTSQTENITLWESSSIIKCQGNWSGINFTWVRDVLIKNLTFTGCYGLSDHYKGPLTFDTAWDVTLENVTVRNNIGFGLHAYRMYGNTKITNCIFLNNSGNMNTKGGNSQFWYPACDHSAHISITDSYFLNGYASYRGYTRYPVATGIAIIVMCTNITFSISHVKVINNHADMGGNMAVTSEAYPDTGPVVTIENSQIVSGSAYYGGGLKIWLHMPKGESSGKPNILVQNVHFIGNRATADGGALYITANQTKFSRTTAAIHIQNCAFTNNSAGSGAAVKIIKHELPRYIKHTSPQFSMVFENCLFSCNFVNSMHIQATIVETYSVERITFENCDFTDNNATALSLISSNARFNGVLRFEKNRAVNGGALKFCQSSAMYISNNTQVLFINNSAHFAGGAIYSEAQCSATSSPCFFQVLLPQSTDRVQLENLDIILNFTNNRASYTGDAIYGGAIEDCFTYTSLCIERTCSTYYSHGLFKTIATFKNQPGNSKISSNPVDVCLCENNTYFDCSNRSHTFRHAVYPGQEFNVTAVVVGQMNGTRPGFVQSIITRGGGNITNIKDGVTELKYRSCQNITLAVGNTTSQVVISFQVKLSDPTSEALYSQYQPPNITVTLKPCPWGFRFAPNKKGTKSCECDPILKQQGIKCYIDNQTILRESPKWIGLFTQHKGNSQNTSGTDSSGVVVKAQCPYDYCRPEPVYLTEFNLADQCASNREGTLCGKCREGYSVTTGGSQCKKCGNKNVFLIPLYLIGGIVLVSILVLFNLTVSTGIIHGLIFYANFVQVNRSIYFPPEHTYGLYNIASVFISWLNVETGMEFCIYSSMDAYAQSWLGFTYPIYIWIIAGLIIFLSKRFNFVTRLVGKNAVKILATLIFLSYAQLVRAAIDVFQIAAIKQGDKKITVWLQDANVRYWEAKRIPLLLVSFLFAIVSLLYAILLTFITCLYRVSHKRAFFWVRKLKPFFDAYTGPYKVKYGFWPGVMFLFRILLFTAFALNVLGEPDLNMLLTVMMCLCILLTAWFLGGVYQNTWVDILEAIFIFNLGIISVCTMFTSDHSSTSGPQQAVVYTSVYTTLLLFFCIVCYHAYKRLITCKGFHSVLEWLQKKQTEREEIQSPVEVPPVENRPLLQPQPMPPVIRYNRYREDLLEYEDS